MIAGPARKPRWVGGPLFQKTGHTTLIVWTAAADVHHRPPSGSVAVYSAVRRLAADIRSQLPPETTCRLDFEPGDVTQVVFGAGPTRVHPGGPALAHLGLRRHQYVKFVWDQTVATWLGCHRRAFEWFAGVPLRVIIDNAKCAIKRLRP